MPNQCTPKRSPIMVIGPSIAYLPLTKGKYSIIDSWRAEELGQWNWCVILTDNGDYYGMRNEKIPGSRKNRCVLLHRYICNPDKGMVVDHINCSKLFNIGGNLRQATKSQNNVNSGRPKTNTTGYKGVQFHKRLGKWMSCTKFNKRVVTFGYFETKELAHIAYLKGIKKVHGEFARLA